MAIIKKPTTVKEKLMEKNVTLTAELWKELTAYAKFAEIGGKPADKQNYIIAEALKNVFANDAEYNAAKNPAPKAKVEVKVEPVKVEEPKHEVKPEVKPVAKK